jgi:hypothetical protein
MCEALLGLVEAARVGGEATSLLALAALHRWSGLGDGNAGGWRCEALCRRCTLPTDAGRSQMTRSGAAAVSLELLQRVPAVAPCVAAAACALLRNFACDGA